MSLDLAGFLPTRWLRPLPPPQVRSAPHIHAACRHPPRKRSEKEKWCAIHLLVIDTSSFGFIEITNTASPGGVEKAFGTLYRVLRDSVPRTIKSANIARNSLSDFRTFRGRATSGS